MPVVLDPDELQAMRDELTGSFPDTAHIMRETAGSADVNVTAVPRTDTAAAIVGGVSDGRGGFIINNASSSDTPANPDPSDPVILPGDFKEVANYPCLVRSVKRGNLEELLGERFTAKDAYMISLPLGADVIVKDRIQVTPGRDMNAVDNGTPAATGGPNFQDALPQYEVTSIVIARSNQTSLQCRIEVLD